MYKIKVFKVSSAQTASECPDRLDDASLMHPSFCRRSQHLVHKFALLIAVCYGVLIDSELIWFRRTESLKFVSMSLLIISKTQVSSSVSIKRHTSDMYVLLLS